MKQITLRKQCKNCSDGEMKSTGVVLTSNPPWYVHKCNSCGISENYLNQCYPWIYTEFEEHEKEDKWE